MRFMEKILETIKWYFECKDFLLKLHTRNMKIKKIMLPITLDHVKGDEGTIRTHRQINDSYKEAKESLRSAEIKLREIASQQAVKMCAVYCRGCGELKLESDTVREECSECKNRMLN